MKKGRIVLMGLAVIFLAAAAAVWFGVYNISARVPHYAATEWLLDLIKDRSVVRHASRVEKTQAADFKENMGIGMNHYHSMCRRCHGAAGMMGDEFAMGLYPAPPVLAMGEEQKEWTEEQLLWIVANGLKMTGMPSFGDTHTREELRHIVTFVEQLPAMDDDRYRELLRRVRDETGGGNDGEEGHSH